MPLQNRVDPYGELRADCARGLLMGNRGGRIYTDGRTLTRRRWTTRAWNAAAVVQMSRPGFVLAWKSRLVTN